MSDNPYANEELVVSTGSVQIESSRAIAEVQAQVIMARKFPRDVVAATDRILAECDRVTLAERAVYSYPRGGMQITGPSIRLAEAILRAWGNCAAGTIEVERNDFESSMLTYAWDLESNAMIRREFKVAHVRDTKQGRKQLTDERDIYELTANYGARRLRACILALIPGDVVDAAVSRCEKTLVAKVGKLEETIPKMVKMFADIGVTKAMIEKRLRHRIESTQAAEVVQMRSVFNSIRDGMGTISDYFEVEGPSKPAEELVKPAKGKPGPKPKVKGDGDLGLDGETSEQIWTRLLAYSDVPNLPESARLDLEEAIEKQETDPVKLQQLLNRIESVTER